MFPTSVAEWGWCLTASTSGLRWWDFPQLAGLAFFLVREVKEVFLGDSSASRMEVWQGTCGGNERVFIPPPALLSSKGYMRNNLHRQESVIPVGVTETVHGPPQSPIEIPTRQLFTNPRAKECPVIEKALFKFLWRSLLPEVGGEVLKKKENVAQRNGFRVNQDRTKTFCDFLVPHHLRSAVHFHDILFKTNKKPF